MKMKQNLHTHSVLDDGVSTLEEMVLSAIDKGFDSIGFSGHSSFDFENDWGLQDFDEYSRQIDDLRKRYDIRIYKGLEMDSFSRPPKEPLDYAIGSVHLLRAGGKILSIDILKEDVISDIDTYFDGNSLEYAKAYFAGLKNIHDADIVGHFDLIEKFNAGEEIFKRKEYMPYAVETMRELVSRGYLFEINTGAMVRGLTTYPYPLPGMMKELYKAGGRIIITTDCHDCKYLDYGYDDAVRLAKDTGYDEIYILTDEGYRSVSLYL